MYQFLGGSTGRINKKIRNIKPPVPHFAKLIFSNGCAQNQSKATVSVAYNNGCYLLLVMKVQELYCIFSNPIGGIFSKVSSM